MFQRVKTAEKSKTEGGIDRKEKQKREDEERRCALDNFTSKKTRRMHRETASEMVSLPWNQNNRKEKAQR